MSRGGIDKVQLFDFNDVTGAVSNAITLDANLPWAYGCEFSPDGTKFYTSVAEAPVGYIHQWDLCAGNNTAVIASKTVIYSTTYANHYAMQMGLDGKVYVAHSGNAPIGAIVNPNAAGTACNYVDAAQPVCASCYCQLGLPNFLTTYFKPALPPFNYTTTCQNVSFAAGPYPTCAAAGYDYTGATWNFGDPASSAGNSATGYNASHFYAPGTYTVLLILNKSCSSDTISQTLTVPAQIPVFSISGPSITCAGAPVTMSANSTANTYSWSTGAQSTAVTVMPAATSIYSVVATNALSGCSLAKTFTVTVNPCTGVAAYKSELSALFVYPNPASDKITIGFNNKPAAGTDVLLRFTDITGREVKSLLIRQENGKASAVKITDLSNGMYLISAQTGDGQLFTGKLIKAE